MITTAFLAPPFGAARTAVFLRYRSPRHPRRQFRRLRRPAVARVQAGDTHIRDAAGQPSGQRKCGRQSKSVGMGHVSTPPPKYNPTSLLVRRVSGTLERNGTNTSSQLVRWRLWPPHAMPSRPDVPEACPEGPSAQALEEPRQVGHPARHLLGSVRHRLHAILGGRQQECPCPVDGRKGPPDQELALLREEIRIKDARMVGCPPIADRTTRPSNGWPSWNSKRPAPGR